MELARQYNRQSRIEAWYPRGLRMRETGIPIDRSGFFYIHFIPPEEIGRYLIPFEDVLLGRYRTGTFRNKVVIVGQTILGAKNADIVPTPFGTQFGVMLQACSLWTILSGKYIYRPDKNTVVRLIFVLAIVLSFLLFSSRTSLNTLVFLLFCLALMLSSTLSFKKWGLFLDMVPLLATGSVCYVSSLGVSLSQALKRVFQKESALRVLEAAEKEITGILEPSEFLGAEQGLVFSPLRAEALIRQTPEITLRTLLASLGVSSGALVFAPHGKPGHTVASVGPLWDKVDLDFLVRQVRSLKAPFIHNKTSGKEPWVSTPEVKNVLALPIISRPGFSLLGIFINKSATVFSDSSFFTPDDVKLAETLSLQGLIAIQNARLNLALKDAQLETIFRLAVAIEYRDRETGMHIHRVSEYASIVARGINLPLDEVELVKSAMPMHDIGKIAIPDNILLKPGLLTEEELVIIRKHPGLGAKMLEGSSSLILKAAEVIALHHQERYDGSGYPQGLKGNDIPVYGRIAALADVFDALSSKRIYKSALSLEKSFEIIAREAGKAIDPKLLDVFFRNRDAVANAYQTYQEMPEQNPFNLPAP